MLISSLDFVEKIDQKFPDLSIQGGSAREILEEIDRQRSLAADGSIAALSVVRNALVSQGIQTGEILNFRSTNDTGTNGTVFATNSTSFQLSATTPGA